MGWWIEMILDAERIAAAMTARVRDPREYLLAFYPALADRIPPIHQVVATARPMIARVNHGLWIASCECGARGAPSPGCVVWLSIPLGWCVRCGNQATGRGWRPIALPPPDMREEIERLLELRAEVGDRNWSPGESIEDLIREQLEHGEPIWEAA